mmetsp:Transcript_21279/g.36495  ORF Transcript_21279/g.36495 Transcript_21279/m.36495 type:complete len:92 (+) Transcript_21279:189-464(+)
MAVMAESHILSFTNVATDLAGAPLGSHRTVERAQTTIWSWPIFFQVAQGITSGDCDCKQFFFARTVDEMQVTSTTMQKFLCKWICCVSACM